MDLNYIAGFLDGEGCIYSRLRKTRHTPETSIEIVNTDRRTLELIRSEFNVGTVRRRSENRLGKKPQWKWVVEGNRKVKEVLEKLVPLLIQKRQLAQRILEIASKPNPAKRKEDDLG